jgi:YD repeat-containing protein
MVKSGVLGKKGLVMSRIRSIVILFLVSFLTGNLAATAGVEEAKAIARLYHAAFDRNPKVAGLNFWVDSYNSGRSLVEIAEDFYQSPEFSSRYGPLSNTKYVEQLYMNILGRPAKPGGLKFWVGHLANGLSRAGALADLASSPENVARTSAAFADMRIMNCQWAFGAVQAPGSDQGCLVGPAASGVAYATPTHRGVTGARGDFQYEKGETVRFMIGDTLLGEVEGLAQVTPFDLASSAALTGPNINWALQEENDPFHAAINIAVLLQSLDYDGDPGNGVEITTAVASLLQRISLDVSQHWETFQYEPRLLRLMGKANRQQRFSVAHGVSKPGTALEYLYGALAINPRILGIKQLQIEDGLGNLENAEYWQYDVNGNVTWHEVDDLGFERWQYDNSGNVTRHERESTNYNVYEIETWQYDNNGNVMLLQEDLDRDGTPERTVSYKYNADGNRTEVASEAMYDHALGTVESWQYDTTGSVTQYKEERFENRKLMGFESVQYDPDGNVTRQEYYYKSAPGDPAFHDIESWQYDDRGNVIWHEQSDQVESWQYQYDASGNITRKEWDNYANGTADSIEKWQYNAKGKVISNECFGDCYGNPWDETANHRIETWEYDSEGKVTRNECIGNCEGLEGWPAADYRLETWQYYANSNLMLHEAEMNLQFEDLGYTYEAGGKFRYRYDATGNLVLEEGDEDRDGNAEYRKSFEYDANGNVTLLQVVEEDDNTGVIIAGNDGPGYNGGNLFVNGAQLPKSEVNDIAFITYVESQDQQSSSGSVRDQGQIFDTGGTVDFTNDTISQSITAGIPGQLTRIQIQFNADIPSPVPRLRFSIFAGGNPPTGASLYSEDLYAASLTDNDLLSWDLTDANLFFETGEQFTFELRTLTEVNPNRIETFRYQYSDRDYLTRRERLNTAGIPENTEAWQYDASGYLTRYERDDNGDGKIDETSTYQYEAAGWGQFFSRAEVYGHNYPPPEKPRPDQDGGY